MGIRDRSNTDPWARSSSGNGTWQWNQGHAREHAQEAVETRRTEGGEQDIMSYEHGQSTGSQERESTEERAWMDSDDTVRREQEMPNLFFNWEEGFGVCP